MITISRETTVGVQSINITVTADTADEAIDAIAKVASNNSYMRDGKKMEMTDNCAYYHKGKFVNPGEPGHSDLCNGRIPADSDLPHWNRNDPITAMDLNKLSDAIAQIRSVKDVMC